jgi:hypothetical protein
MVTVATTATVAPAVGEVIVEVGGMLSGVGVGLAGVLGRLVIPQPAVSASKVTMATPVISLHALT